MTKFLDQQGLVYYNQVIDNKLKKKQDVISDLESIRTKATTGANLATKVNSIAEGAEPNKITAITFNGNEVTVENKVAAIMFNGYTKSETDARIGEKIAEIVAGADENYDTLKEIADWIISNPESAAALASKVATIEQSISDINVVRSNALTGYNYAILHKNDEEGAQVNIIEQIKVNGVVLPVAEKTVNIDVSSVSLEFSDDQKAAINSGVTSDKIAAYDAYATLIDKKLDVSAISALTESEIDVALGIQN